MSMVQQIIGVAAHDQTTSSGMGVGGHDQGRGHQPLTKVKDLDEGFAEINMNLQR